MHHAVLIATVGWFWSFLDYYIRTYALSLVLGVFMQCCTSATCFHCCTGFTKWLNFILAPTDSLGHTLPNMGRKGTYTLHMWCHTLPNMGCKGTYTLHMWCHTLPNMGCKGTHYTCGPTLSPTWGVKVHTTHVVPHSPQHGV